MSCLENIPFSAVVVVVTLCVHALLSEGQYICYTQYGYKGTCCHPSNCVPGYAFRSTHCGWGVACCLRLQESVEKTADFKRRESKYKRERWTSKQPIHTTTTTSTSTTTTVMPSIARPNLQVRGCGIRRTLTNYIIGGRNSEAWPWMAAIYVRPRRNSINIQFQCGGSVISRRFILTAAHCLIIGKKPLPPKRVTIRVGSVSSDSGGQLYQVADVIIHSDYRSTSHYDDIALLRLSQDITTRRVAPVCLPPPVLSNSNFSRRNATVIGWGLTSVDGQSSNKLQVANLSVVSNRRCGTNYRNLNVLSLSRGIIETQMCAGTTDGSKDTCQGDSGGPLLLTDNSGKWTVVGLVSFGYGCAEAEYPGVYTRVSKYLAWLRDNTDIASQNN